MNQCPKATQSAIRAFVGQMGQIGKIEKTEEDDEAVSITIKEQIGDAGLGTIEKVPEGGETYVEASGKADDKEREIEVNIDGSLRIDQEDEDAEY